MCVVSMIGDYYKDKWNHHPYPNLFKTFPHNVSRLEFEALKKEVEEMKKLLERAKEYDEKNNEPNCEIESKIELLKKVAELFEIDLNNVFKK